MRSPRSAVPVRAQFRIRGNFVDSQGRSFAQPTRLRLPSLIPRRWHEGGKTCECLDGRHHALGYPASRGLLHAVRDVAVAAYAEAREREGRPVEVPAEALASEVVVGFDVDAGVKVEALVRDGVGRAGCRLRRQAGPCCGERLGGRYLARRIRVVRGVGSTGTPPNCMLPTRDEYTELHMTNASLDRTQRSRELGTLGGCLPKCRRYSSVTTDTQKAR